jgi:hypothetical protein
VEAEKEDDIKRTGKKELPTCSERLKRCAQWQLLLGFIWGIRFQ